MLKELVLEDFQCHTYRTVPLGPITTIVGPSDRGKSALIRALQWLCTNKPTGDGDTHWGADDRAVHLRVDGHLVTRSKGKAGNFYQIDDAMYTAFGASVPDDVLNLLQLDTDEVNFQSQHDAAFWLTATPGQLSQALNRIVDLQCMDEAIGAANAAVTRSTNELRVRNQVVAEAHDRLTALAFAPTMDEQMHAIEATDGQWREKRSWLATITNYVADAKKESKIVKDTADMLHSWRVVDHVAEKLKEAKKELDDVQQAVQAARRAGATVATTKVALQAAQQELNQIEICPTCQRPQ